MRAALAMTMLVASTALAACGTSSPTNVVVSPTGTVAFTAPAGGETLQVGDTVALAWTCPDCANVPAGDYVQVAAFDGVSFYLVADSAQLTDSASWVVGTSLQGADVLPGFYLMALQDAAGYYTAQSRFFQVAASP
jgi:hypothetical protein